MKKSILKRVSALLLFAVITSMSFGCLDDEKEDDSWYTDITVGTPISDDIKAYGTKVYRINFASIGSYTATLSAQQSNCGITLCSYDESDESLGDLVDNIIGEVDVFNDTTNEVATIGVTVAGYAYIVIDEWDDVDSGYTLTITSGTKSESKEIILDTLSQKTGAVENAVIDKIMDKWDFNK